ncbi:DUF1905 domain-containing protein [Sphingomonas sp. LB-2]|uniref:DUF1905 domain-containing protein n=1 Tax=Sphingomonas caeni TaxID=2984949 RepID=UPI0022326EF8|nr:DUF1905 domain-containing protein [Sphingomonas caeni]MCW3846137.1 DUF1905 domain-containing protein [Sphingomonas caeni]
MTEIFADITFDAEVIEWRGPSPFYFAAVPPEHIGEIRYAAQMASYGWGVVPVEAEVRGVIFRTSLFPRDGGYLLPLKDKVRREAGIVPGGSLHIRMRVTGPRPG